MSLAEQTIEPVVDMHDGLDAGLLPAIRQGGTPALRHVLVGLDAAAVFSAWFVTYLLLPAVHHGYNGIRATLTRSVILTGISILLLAGQHLYRSNVCSSRIVELAGLARVAALASLFSVVGYRLIGVQPAPAAVVVGGLLSLALLISVRGFYDTWLRAERTQGRFTRRVVVVGQGDEAERVIDLLGHHPDLGYRVCGLVGDRSTAAKHVLPWMGGPHDALEAITASGATGVVLVASGLPADEVNRLTRALLLQGLHVQASAGLWGVGHSRLHVAPLAHEPFFSLKAAGLSPTQFRIKRGLDLAVALPVLVLSAPILLLVAVAVKLQDGGPVLFRQVRVGRNGQTFTLFKFRTMAVDAEARLSELLAKNERNGPLFKMDNDPRVTRVGRLLRATSLDELPQLFNVVGGSMSMVGPRPALPLEVATFDDDLLGRHSLPPGVTGLWQIEARDNPSFYAYRHLDLFYVQNWSCALDLMVLAGTAPNLLARSVRTFLGRSDTAVPAVQLAVIEP
jgi:exopolysaccharide biosynthesis polyprenyl glycosylphosphotransferase